jgi:hypothetical protein
VSYKVKVTLRPTVSRHPSGTRDQFFPFSFWLFLDSCGFVDVGRPLWREVEPVLSSFCRASPAQPFSDLNPTGLMSIVYCLYFQDSPNLEIQVPEFISPRNRVAQLYPRALGLEVQSWGEITSGGKRTKKTEYNLLKEPWTQQTMGRLWGNCDNG